MTRMIEDFLVVTFFLAAMTLASLAICDFLEWYWQRGSREVVRKPYDWELDGD
jgi:hypothetical protein